MIDILSFIAGVVIGADIILIAILILFMFAAHIFRDGKP